MFPHQGDDRDMLTLRAFKTIACALLFLFAGCASLPKDYPRDPSYASDRWRETKLSRALAPSAEQHPGMSGFHVLGNGMDAFVARMVLADSAERTLDLQYYIFHGDFTGKLILDSLMRAADRGVRVRLLIDDTAAKGRDPALAAIGSHTHVEVRVFNPAAGRSAASWLFSAAADFDRINHRMHNKMFVADNQAGVVGGRNIGDEYFGAREGVNFADMDLLAVGPVVRELSRSFDDYWNSEWAYPIEALYTEKPDPGALKKGRDMLTAHRSDAWDSEYAKRLHESDLLKKLLERDLPFIWAPTQIVYDRPEKAGSEGHPAEELKLGTKLKSTVAEPQSEFLISSPYFIPGREGVASFKRLREKGVQVRIVTNSFAGNDVALVHSGYARYRKDLLKLDVDLYELKPSLAAAREEDRDRFGSSGASLHAKAFIVDREQVFVGSLNLDPRSMNLNTELGFVVESRELADILFRQFNELIKPAFTYHLKLDPSNGDIVWITEENGKQVRYTSEPGVGFWKRFSTWFLSIFAPESLL
jgi:putative cardiolipin synthase